MDVISLAALLAHIANLVANPLNGAIEHGLDLIAIGKLYAELGHPDIAAQIYQRGLQFDDINPESYWQALKELSFLHKKRANIETACQLWEQAAENGQIYAHIELAKIFEHRQKDFATAARWTEAAILIATQAGFPAYERDSLLPELEHRLARLKRKLETSD
jgi:hypothetical protein